MTGDPAEAIRVLLVDDDEEDHFMFRELLSEIGAPGLELKWASTYEQGSRAIQSGEHDICFLDFRLGVRTGLDLLKEMIAQGCTLPLVLLTGHGEREVDLEAMAAGAADYLIKDQVTPPLLERTIRYGIHRAQALEALRQREEGFRSLLDSTFEGILVHEITGKIHDANRAAARMFGYELGNLIGSSLGRLCSPECVKMLDQAIVRDSEISVESTGIRKDGSQLHLEVSSKPYRHMNRPMRLTAFRDLTSRKAMEAQILMQDRLASVGLLASSLAHEIGTPLGVIRGRAEYLESQSSDAALVKRSAEIIVSQIDRVSRLIRSLLNLARGDQNRLADDISLAEVLNEVIELMAHEFRKHSIEIRNEIPGNVRIAVRAEAEPLHQVLLNLLVNSLHAIGSAVKEGRKTGHFVRIGALDQGAKWAVLIEDTGCGISPENMKNLFKPFFTTKDIGVGTGLGLATSYRIVESWGGRIQAESVLGKSTTFRITLPKAGLGS